MYNFDNQKILQSVKKNIIKKKQINKYWISNGHPVREYITWSGCTMIATPEAETLPLFQGGISKCLRWNYCN